MVIKNLQVLLFSLFLILLVFTLDNCKSKHHRKQIENTEENPIPAIVKVKKPSLRIIRQFPHSNDRNYTQGLEYYKGFLYESTGLVGQSSLKKIDVKTGNVIQQKNIDNYFAEGITIMDETIYQLSWKDMKTFSFSLKDFSDKNKNFTYNTEGWGLTDDGSAFIMTDGSDKIFFRNKETFNIEKIINVNYEGSSVLYLNELEYVNNKIYANVYGSPMIYSIDPANGNILEAIDCSSVICSQISKDNPENVLNGIAYNKETKTFYITGKRCPVIYEVVFE